MPELPEVETVRRGLVLCLRGARLLEVSIRREDLRWPIPANTIQGLPGCICRGIDRRAKYLLLHLDHAEGYSLLIHLGMSGRMVTDGLDDCQAMPEWQTHEHWRMLWKRQGQPPVLLRFTDPRRFGMLDCTPRANLERHPLLAKLGPEPLGDRFSPKALFDVTRGRKGCVKGFIMDARRVVGVGNIYASEVCFRAGIRPQKPVGELRVGDCTRLVETIHTVLTEAIAQGGTTLRDYIGVDASRGGFQACLRVYGRAGLACLACGAIIKKIMLGSRSTFYCPCCQC